MVQYRHRVLRRVLPEAPAATNASAFRLWKCVGILTPIHSILRWASLASLRLNLVCSTMV